MRLLSGMICILFVMCCLVRIGYENKKGDEVYGEWGLDN